MKPLYTERAAMAQMGPARLRLHLLLSRIYHSGLRDGYYANNSRHRWRSRMWMWCWRQYRKTWPVVES